MDFRNLSRDAGGYAWLNKAYTTLDFMVTKKIGFDKHSANLTLAVNNLLDNRFEKSLFQSDPGRIVRGEIGVNF
ncbi:MAG: hypothetical protein ACXWE3_00240 [Methylobacter sp.]